MRAASTGEWAGVYAPMLGYWGNSAATAETLPDGELRSGDIGYVDEAGNVYVLDRAKSVILRGGQNIYPAEVERLLKTHPAVRDVAVLPVPDERFGEIAIAAVEVGPEPVEQGALERELAALCARELAKYKHPERWLMLPELPRNAMMKINRGELRDRCLALIQDHRRSGG